MSKHFVTFGGMGDFLVNKTWVVLGIQIFLWKSRKIPDCDLKLVKSQLYWKDFIPKLKAEDGRCKTSWTKNSDVEPAKPVEMLPVLPRGSAVKLNSMLESPALKLTQGGEQQGRGKCLESKVNYWQQKKQLSYIIKRYLSYICWAAVLL